jgi:glycosyltransferase involved in cell wall biosynthesis
MPEVSVIVTVYEQPESLLALLYSLAHQRCEVRFEIVICDDGSSLKVNDWIANDAELQRLELICIWQPHIGPRAARSKNNGIRCARGRVLLFLDGDIVVGPDFVQRHVTAHYESRQIVCNSRLWVTLRRDGGNTKLTHDTPGPVLPRVDDIHLIAKEDYARLIRLLHSFAIDVDREYQRKLWISGPKWMTPIGFSWSIDRDDCVYFDEAFVGWGPEDRELAFRLTAENNFSVQYLDDLQVYHIESSSTGRTPFTLWPKSPTEILGYLRNMIYLTRKYPNADFSPLMTPLLSYTLAPGGEEWKYGKSDPFRDREQEEAALRMHLSFIESWLEVRGIPLPKHPS